LADIVSGREQGAKNRAKYQLIKEKEKEMNKE